MLWNAVRRNDRFVPLLTPINAKKSVLIAKLIMKAECLNEIFILIVFMMSDFFQTFFDSLRGEQHVASNREYRKISFSWKNA